MDFYLWKGRIYPESQLPDPAKARLQARGILPDRLPATASAAPAKSEESEIEATTAVRRDDLTAIKGIGKVRQEELNTYGIYTYEELAHARLDVLVSVMEVNRDTLAAWIEDAARLDEGAAA